MTNPPAARAHASVAFVVCTLVAVLSAREARALTACTALDIARQDSGCPNNTGPCTVTKVFTVADGCVLDFGARALTVGPGTLDIGSGSVMIKAGSLTVTASGLIDGRGTGFSPPTDHGGMIAVETTGTVSIQRAPLTFGRVDVRGHSAGGAISITAGLDVSIAGMLT